MKRCTSIQRRNTGGSSMESRMLGMEPSLTRFPALQTVLAVLLPRQERRMLRRLHFLSRRVKPSSWLLRWELSRWASASCYKRILVDLEALPLSSITPPLASKLQRIPFVPLLLRSRQQQSMNRYHRLLQYPFLHYPQIPRTYTSRNLCPFPIPLSSNRSTNTSFHLSHILSLNALYLPSFPP